MRVLFAIAVIVSIALTGSSVSASSWLPDGGLSGHTINALIVNKGALFAGTSDSGVYRSSDKGQSWLAINAGLTDVAITSLTAKDGFLFAGTVSGGVFRSADSGRNWLPVNTGISSTNIKALAANNTCIFAGTGGGGVCRSTDYGTNWLEVNKLEDGTDIHFKNIFSFGVTADYVFIGTWGGSAFRSADNGTVWYMVTNGMADPRENQIPRCFAVLDSFIFAGLDGAGMLRAKDSARIWFTVNTGLPESTSVTALAVFKNSLYAATHKGVFNSTDNGNTWSAVNTGLSTTPVYTFASIDTTLFAGTSNGIWQFNSDLLPTKTVRLTQAVDPLLQSKFLSLSGSAITYQTGTQLSGIVTVCSPNGAIVISKKVMGIGTINFNRQELAKGLYIIQLQVGQWQDHRMLFR